MSALFGQLDTVQQRESYIKARKMSETTDNPIVLHCRVLGGNLGYSLAHAWEHWDTMEICRFRRGRELHLEYQY